MRTNDFFSIFNGEDNSSFTEVSKATKSISKIAAAREWYLYGAEVEDIFAFAQQESILFEPTNNEYRLTKDTFSKETLDKLQEFLEKFSPRYDCVDVNIYHTTRTGEQIITGVDTNKVADFLLQKFIFKTIFGSKNADVHVYTGSIYEKVGEGFIKVESEKVVKGECNNHLVAEIIGKIERRTGVSREEFENSPLNFIPFDNCCFNIETKEPEKFKPEYNFKFKLSAPYIKCMDCQQFKIFLEKVLYPEDIKLLQEFFGFVFYRKYFIKKGFILVGGKDTGKTTLINILVGLIGIKNCSGISLQRISQNDKFAISSLHNKHLNFYDDLSFKDLNDGGGFKIATGGGYVTAEYKFADSFQFQNYAKLLFATNKIPVIKDIDDEAYYYRWLPVQFDNEIPKEEQDPFMAEKLMQESAGIVNWALEGLDRLIQNKKFSSNKTPEEVKAIMCRSGNPLYAFVSDVLQQQDGAKVSKEQMYEIYKIYALENKLTPLSKEQLGRQLGRVAYYVAPKRSGGQGGERFWENVSLVSNNPKLKSIYDAYDTSINNIYPVGNSKLYITSEKVSLVSQDDSKEAIK